MLLCHYYFVDSNIEVIQSQLKNIYTNTLSTLCPLPWLEEAEDVQYNFDDVFIPLHTIDIDLQKKTSDQLGTSGIRKEQKQTEDLSRPSVSTDIDFESCSFLFESSDSSAIEEQTSDLSGSSDSNADEEQTSHLSVSSDSSADEEQPGYLPRSSDSSAEEEQPGYLSRSSDSSADEEQPGYLPGLSDSSADEEQPGYLPGLSDSSADEEQVNGSIRTLDISSNRPGTSEEMELRCQSRYMYDNTIIWIATQRRGP